ncbi:DEAD/DEAH box helicase [Leptolinea tardivitalis]|uniref:Helicase n=1 Tax=Leptolinea tardivitalis TaxID=229920 RepID=A0A0N8GLH2_9CHLR|nr:DEAD/DEAH box helicase family protein [Leptolinea tardivitalis]KPL72490.1 hypothetical protein ADM99_04975 [Leptolinea tardivitalis]GAP21227.1 DNA or RNA helicases of superfamily II [Leptolinea tardivitalis]
MNAELREVNIPGCYSSKISIGKNNAQQLLEASEIGLLDFQSNPLSVIRKNNQKRINISSNVSVDLTSERYLFLRSGALQHPEIIPFENQVNWRGNLFPEKPSEVILTWKNNFEFVQEDNASGKAGLRLPQLGALHSILGYWTTDNLKPATVVLPTGTGKTETMLALLVAAQIESLLVVVPSDVLRSQLSKKFETFGVLQKSGVIGNDAHRPVVGQLRQAFESVDDANAFCSKCNVIITTPDALYASSDNIWKEILHNFSHLFIDEAHHVEANTWNKLRSHFENKYVLQFTATPFREDGKRVAGQIIYSFPLRQAQKLGYFSKINYLPVTKFEEPDIAIAKEAIAQLRRDLTQGFQHILMARVKRIGRAEEILQIYKELASDFNPVILHSTLDAQTRKHALEEIRNNRSRIIICVNMLGEGFDLPNLKIAAIHDAHKSLCVTLQFIGRFTRVSNISIGNASIITSKPEGIIDENLRKLYSEDPDWNYLIQDLSETSIAKEKEANEFDNEFGKLPEDISIKSIDLKMSTVIYRTHCDAWNPEAIYDYIPVEQLFTNPIAVNEKDKVVWFIVENRIQVEWGTIETIKDIRYDFFALFWDEGNDLLYINGSSTDSIYSDLAKTVCGGDVEIIKGEEIYRSMARIDRLVPTNVGVLDIRNRSRRFSLFVGADVIEGFPIAEAQTKTKTNIFANGFENGYRVSIGASLKGRIWSYRIASSLNEWVEWCNHIGKKVTDSNINIDDVMGDFIRPIIVESRPPYVALGVEWPYEVYANCSDEIRLKYAGHEWALIDSDLKISNFNTNENIQFEIVTPDMKVGYEIFFLNNGMNFRAITDEIRVVIKRNEVNLSDFLNNLGLSILLEQEAKIEPPGLLLKPNRNLLPYDKNKIITLDWDGINIRKESQGHNRDVDSIQYKVTEYVKSLLDWDLIIDDDGSGEIGDIVALKIDGHNLIMHISHCKFSTEDSPGARIEDLYEVCGQAQKSVIWHRNLDVFFKNLIRRERNRGKNHQTGLIVGDRNLLLNIQEKWRYLIPNLTISIAQPGLSKNKVSSKQLELLSSTEVYIYEVAHAKFIVISSS